MFPLIIASAWWAGYELVTLFVPRQWDPLKRIFSGFPLGMMYQSFVALVLQYYIPWGTAHLLLVLTIFVLLSVALHFINAKNRPSLRVSLKVIDIIALVVMSAFLLYRMKLVYFEKGVFTRGAAFSDFAFHMELVSSFAFGCNVNRTWMLGFETIISAGNPLAYPVLVNFHAAFLVADCGASIQNATKWTAFVVTMCMTFMVYSLTMQFTNGNSYAAALSIPLWCFSGGLGFLELLDYGLEKKHPRVNYVHYFNSKECVFWFQTLAHVFHPQRCATFALPLCYVVIGALLDGIEKFELRFFGLAALYVGILPQTQVHGYVSIAIFSLSLACTTFPLSKKWTLALKCWTLFGVVANIIALPLCTPFFARTSSNSRFFEVSPIWRLYKYTIAKDFPFIDIWWNALGVFGLIALGAGFVTATLAQARIYLASLVVCLIGSTLMFQPWELDNCKVFLAGWMPLAVPMVAQYFTHVWSRTSSTILKMIVAVLYVSCLCSGIVCLATCEEKQTPIAEKDYTDLGNWVSENVPVLAVTHMSETLPCPVSMYGGRRMFHECNGWVTSHGLSGRAGAASALTHGRWHEVVSEFDVGYFLELIGQGIYGSPEKMRYFTPVYSADGMRLWRLLRYAMDLPNPPKPWATK